MSWRAIHDSVAASESLAAVSHGAERLYWRLLATTDSYGRHRGEPSKVRATCMPMLAVGDDEIEGWLDELEQVRRIVRYQVDGRAYIQITDFDLNQPTEFLRRRGRERYPAPPRSRTTPGPPENPSISRELPDHSGGLPDHSGVEAEAEAEAEALSSSTSTEDAAAAAETNFQALGWRTWQIKRAQLDPKRAAAWAAAAETRANGNPGGYAWSGFDSGDWPTTTTTPGEEKPKMDVAEACQHFIEGHGWDDSYDEQAILEEFGRISRRGRTTGTLTKQTSAGLLEQWKATRQDRYGTTANHPAQ